MTRRNYANVVHLSSVILPIALFVFAVLQLKPAAAIAQAPPPGAECGYGIDSWTGTPIAVGVAVGGRVVFAEHASSLLRRSPESVAADLQTRLGGGT